MLVKLQQPPFKLRIMIPFGTLSKFSTHEEIIAVSNFTPVPYVAYRLGVPRPGVYSIILNTDDKKYWGSGYKTGPEKLAASNISWQGQYHSIVLDLPPLATVFIKRVSE